MHGTRAPRRASRPSSLAVLLLAVLSSATATGAGLTVGTASAPCGGQVSIPVTVDDASGLLAVQFRLAFDAAKLTAGAVSTGPITSGFSLSSSASGGVLSVALASGSPAPTGSAVVVNLGFTVGPAVAAGPVALTISAVLLNDVPSSGQSGSITVSCGSTAPVAASWILASSARVQGAGAFWTTDLTIRNPGTTTAGVTLKFLGHGADGRQGPEVTRSFAPGETRTFADVLKTLFNLESDYGPILLRSTVTELVVVGLTSTPGGGGTYGQSVPAAGPDDYIGQKARSIPAVRQDGAFRTNLVLANAAETQADVDVQLVSAGGSVLAVKHVTLGPLSRAQFNVAADFGQANLADAALVLSSPGGTPSVAAYAALIDNATGDPRTLLPQ